MLRVSPVPSPSFNTQRRVPAPLVMALIAVVILAVRRATAVDAIWYPLIGSDAGVSPVDPANLQLVWPMLGQGVAWVPVWLAGAAIAILAFHVLRNLGAGLLAASAATLAWSFSISLWVRVSTEQATIAAVLFFLSAIGGLLLWRESRRTLPLAVAAVTYALAVTGHPAALGALPAIVWVAGPRTWPGAAMVLAAAVGATGFWWSAGGGVSPAGWFVPGGLGAAGDRLRAVLALLVADFGVLGVAFLLIGCVRCAARSDRLVLLAGAAAGAGAWALMWGAPAWQDSLLLAFAPLWLLVGIGMEWVGTLAETRAARIGAAALVALLPAMSLTAHFENGARARGANVFTARYLDHLEAVVPPGAVVVAEGGLLDHHLAERIDRHPNTALGRIPQTPAAVAQALGGSRTVVAFAGAREQLRALGFRFETVKAAGVLMSVEEFLATVPDGWIVAVAASPEFLRAVAPNGGPTFGVIGGTQDLFGKSRWHYGLVGVKGDARTLVERGETAEVDITVRGADPLTPYLRSPVSLRVRSLSHAAIVEYRGDQVARTETGLALAVISPSGTFGAAYDATVGPDGGILVNPVTLMPGLVTGREPCVETLPGQWTNVSDLAGRASLGGLVDRGQDLTLYVASSHPLTPRAAGVGRLATPAIDVTTIDTASEVGLSTLRDLLRGDGLDTSAPELAKQQYVYRIHAAAPQSGRRQIALQLGGFATLGFARVGNGAVAPVTLCSSMETAVDLDIDLGRRELFVYGWADPEISAGARFRWTRALRAELLLPIARPETMTVGIDARPMAGHGTTMELTVNDTTFAPVAMETASREYRWVVPAEIWRAGMNRVWLGVSARARPSDLNAGGDTRLLGLGVRQIRLIPEGTTPGPRVDR